MKPNEYGSWLPWSVVMQAVKFRLRPASRWQVYLLLLCTSCRFGGKEARLSVAEIAAKTGLSERTVKAALADLIAAGHVRRLGRYRKLVVTAITPISTPALTSISTPFPEITELPLPRDQTSH